LSQGGKLFCFGYGYTAAGLARRIGNSWEVTGTTSREDKAASMRADGVEALLWKGSEFNPEWLDGVTHILVSTPPDENGCPALIAARVALKKRCDDIKWIGYLWSNGVYGDYDGGWVDETSELRATSPRAKRRVIAEESWRAFAKANNIPLIIFRLPGIYGPGRSALDTVRAGKAKRIVKEGQVFNRMHVDDIASALAAGIERPLVHDLYNLADDEPSPPQDVILYACELLEVPPPPATPIEAAELSDMARSFYADNKRVSNKRMKEALGVTLQYPTYRDGLRAIYENETKPG
jgi:nucleoside-diphosphate-sugar epimerase